MAPFYPIFVRRSDGKLEVQASKNHREANEPTADQLNQKPNAQGLCDFYRHCQTGDAKETDWRRKLAGMLMREIGNKEPKDRIYILAALPENYRVFEHVKCKLADVNGKAEKASNNHAAGPNERQDAYLYGHPIGRKKRYRSPAEFFPHLLWLATDEAGNPDNCSCKFCSPEEMETDEKPQARTSAKEIKQEQRKSTEISTRPVPKAAFTQPLTTQRATTIHAPRQVLAEPSPLPRFKSLEQKLDAQPNKLTFRNGEVVWFSRSSAWGLGVVAKRDQNQQHYRIQPFSHPFNHPPPQICSQDQLRPWLAWSPPPCTSQNLNPNAANQNRIYSYDSIDWQAVIDGKFGIGDAEVDGSIFAAKAVETTYTPFDFIETTSTDFRYNGIYLGAEKCWVGDALRIRNPANPSSVMVLHEIIEVNLPQGSQKTRILFVGDIYSQAVAQLDPRSVPKSDLHLPSRVREDLQFRNRITWENPIPEKRYTVFLKLEAKSVRVGIESVKGRWYENSLMLPMLVPDKLSQMRAGADFVDFGNFMNGQGDCNKPPAGTPGSTNRDGSIKSRPADIKTTRREDAFGRAVPSTLKISRGLDEPKKEASSDAGRSDSKTSGSVYQQSQPPLQSQVLGSYQSQGHSYQPGQQQAPREEAIQPQHINDAGRASNSAQNSLGQYTRDVSAGESLIPNPGYDEAFQNQNFDHELFGDEEMQQ